MTSKKNAFRTCAGRNPKTFAVIATGLLLLFFVAMLLLLSIENMRHFTDPASGKVSNAWWVEPAALGAAILAVGWWQRDKRKH